MKNKNCTIYYQNIKSLFPKVDYKEGRFLRDLRKQIEEYAMQHPNATYKEIEEAFGTPEDIIYDFFSLAGTLEVVKSVKKKKFQKLVILIVAATICFFISAYLLLWYISYREYTDSLVNTKETIIYEGEESYE